MDPFDYFVILFWIISVCGVAHTLLFARLVFWVTRQKLDFHTGFGKRNILPLTAQPRSAGDPDAAEDSEMRSINEILDKRAAQTPREDSIRVVDGDLLRETKLDGDDAETLSKIKKFKFKG